MRSNTSWLAQQDLLACYEAKTAECSNLTYAGSHEHRLMARSLELPPARPHHQTRPRYPIVVRPRTRKWDDTQANRPAFAMLARVLVFGLAFARASPVAMLHPSLKILLRTSLYCQTRKHTLSQTPPAVHSTSFTENPLMYTT